MAILVAKTVMVTVNGVDLSANVLNASLNIGAKEIDISAMGATTEIFTAGLLNWSVDVDFQQDFAASKVDATLFPLLGAAAFTVAFKPTNGATSATNPQYSGLAILTGYSPIGNKVGELMTTKVTFKAAGALSRATS